MEEQEAGGPLPEGKQVQAREGAGDRRAGTMAEDFSFSFSLFFSGVYIYIYHGYFVLLFFGLQVIRDGVPQPFNMHRSVPSRTDTEVLVFISLGTLLWPIL